MLRKIMMVIVAASALTGGLTAHAVALPNMEHLHSARGETSPAAGPFGEFSAHIGQSDARSQPVTEYYGESRIGGYDGRPYLLESQPPTRR